MGRNEQPSAAIIDSQTVKGTPESVEESGFDGGTVSYTHLRAHETVLDLVCRLLLEKNTKTQKTHTDIES